MTEKRVAVGSTGRTVAERVKQLREDQNLTYAELGRRMAKAGRPTPVLALSRIENLERRVDADDLVALAQALGVSPTTLLMPKVKNVVDETIEVTAHERPNALRFFHWLQAEAPVEECDEETLELFRLRSRPRFKTYGSDAVTPAEFEDFWKRGINDGDN